MAPANAQAENERDRRSIRGKRPVTTSPLRALPSYAHDNNDDVVNPSEHIDRQGKEKCSYPKKPCRVGVVNLGCPSSYIGRGCQGPDHAWPSLDRRPKDPPLNTTVDVFPSLAPLHQFFTRSNQSKPPRYSKIYTCEHVSQSRR